MHVRCLLLAALLLGCGEEAEVDVPSAHRDDPPIVYRVPSDMIQQISVVDGIVSLTLVGWEEQEFRVGPRIRVVDGETVYLVE